MYCTWTKENGLQLHLNICNFEREQFHTSLADFPHHVTELHVRCVWPLVASSSI